MMSTTYFPNPCLIPAWHVRLTLTRPVVRGLVTDSWPAGLLACRPHPATKRIAASFSAAPIRCRKSLKILDLLLRPRNECRVSPSAAPATSQQRHTLSSRLDRSACPQSPRTLLLPSTAGNEAHSPIRIDLRDNSNLTLTPATPHRGAFMGAKRCGRPAEHAVTMSATSGLHASVTHLKETEKNFQKNRALLCETVAKTGFLNQRADILMAITIPWGKRTSCYQH